MKLLLHKYFRIIKILWIMRCKGWLNDELYEIFTTPVVSFIKQFEVSKRFQIEISAVDPHNLIPMKNRRDYTFTHAFAV